jgi:predicted DNA-binding transcriptional regulator YafY
MDAELATGANEPKIVLLVRLLNAIDEGNHGFESLKERISEGGKRPSTRSLRRYLAVLADAGFPWYFDRAANAYRFAGGYSLKRLALSNGELFGLVALRSLGSSLGGAIGSSIDDVTEKLIGTAGRDVKARVGAQPPVAFQLTQIRLDERAQRAFDLLSAAERATRSVQFLYLDKDGNPSTRIVDPYGFIISSGRVYCVAFDHGRSDKRTFAVDNISDPMVLARTFVRPTGFDIAAYAAPSISGVLTGDELAEVRVRFAPRVAKAAIAARVVAERQIERGDDGSVEIVYRVADIDELVRWVLGWGAQAEIVEPLHVRERIAALAESIAQRYSLVEHR